MALNRILGNILSDNLQRSANLSFNSTLLFLDVPGNRVGINSNAPEYDFDVNGTFSAGNIVIGNIVIPDSGNMTMGGTTLTGLPYPASNTDAATKEYVDALANGVVGSNLQFNNTTISTTFANSNITIVPSGSGNLVVGGTGNILGNNLTLAGYVDSDQLIANGNITTNSYFVGDGSQIANLNLGNFVYTNVIPSMNVLYTLGNSVSQWKDVWFSNSLQINNTGITSPQQGILNIGGNQIVTQTPAGNISTVTISATGNITGYGNVIAGRYFIGDGGVLSNIQYSTIVGKYSNANVANYLSSGSIVSNIRTSGYFIGDGSKLTNINSANITGAYSNANVASYLSSNLVTTNINTSANVNSAFFIGDGGYLTNVSGSYSNANVANYFSSNLVTTDINTSANINATYFTGNGSLLTGLPAGYANSNVANYLPTYTGNISAQYFLGDGIFGNLTVDTISGSSNSTGPGGNINIDGGQGTGGSNGTVFIGSNVTTNGVVIGHGNGEILIDGSLTVGGSIVPTANNNSSLGNPYGLWGDIWSGSNVNANYFNGNGSQLTGMYSNSNVASYLETYGGNMVVNSITATTVTVGGWVVKSYGAITVGTTPQVIVEFPLEDFNMFSFEISAVDTSANNCQVLKMSVATINGVVKNSEYGAVAVGNTIAAFDVSVANANMILTATPYTPELISYNVLVSNFA